MSVKIYANYHLIKSIQKTCRLSCSSNREINFVFTVFYFNIRSFEP